MYSTLAGAATDEQKQEEGTKHDVLTQVIQGSDEEEDVIILSASDEVVSALCSKENRIGNLPAPL